MGSLRFASFVVGVAAGAAALAAPADAHAFTTRVHIAIANDLRTALVASGGSSIALKLGPYSVVLSAADAKAISEQPLAFRAGAVGPDNVIFPGMTDPSHAIEQRPFEQCQLLYDAAITDEERAYAIGCFLHGSTDAIAHHYVNWMTGETFTLNPITSARGSSWSNVVRHMVAEAMIQKAAYGLKPAAFGAGALAHAIPKGFVLRAYFDTKSPLWQVAAKHAKDKLDAARAAKPGASLPTVIGSAGLAPAEQLVLAPLYIEEIEASRTKLRANVVASIAAMQDTSTSDGAKLKVTAGADGKLGTYDDKTACSASCPTLYAKYFTYVGLLQPRKSASGATLPSAFDKISDELGSDLRAFSPALVQTIENVSTELNKPVTASSDGLDLDKGKVATLFSPMRDWADDVTTIDYEAVTKAVVPEWLQDLEDLMSTAGVSVKIPDVVAALMQPIVDPIKDALKGYVIDQAETYVGTLVDEYKKGYATTTSEFEKRLALSAGAGSKGTALENLFDSGLWAHSFNVAAAAIAKHDVVLPDPGDVGPATFDASHTPAWMQLGVCDYLRSAVFPLGLDVKALLTVRTGDATYEAKVTEDAPFECHDGSLSAFAASPTVETCKLTKLSSLMTSKRGSVSRAYPPALAASKPACRNLKVEGLPDPPETPDAGVPVDDAGVPLDDAGNPIDPVPNAAASTEDAGGCGCRVTGGATSGATSSLLALAGVAGIVLRRRRRAAVLAAAMLGAGAGGCSGGDGEGTPTVESDAGAEVESDVGSEDVAADGADADIPDTSVDAPSDTAPDATPDADPAAAKLLEALGDSVWSATQTRTEKGASKTRAYELRFRASGLEWAEVRNPFGPARMRTLRVFTVDPDGKTVRSTILSPAGWPTHPDNGKKETWSFEVLPGSPRKLQITSGGKTETFTEGAWAKPTSGLTAFVSVFSTTGKVNDAFCGTGSFSSIDRAAIWEFARGKSTEKPVGSDVVAGARLLTWNDLSAGDNWAVGDVDGFATLGGTELSDQANFVVRYVGTVKHTGSAFRMRELDDDVKDAVWAFLGGKVGSLSVSDLFLEVHGKAAADSTPDEPSTSIAAGDVPIEIFVLRCAAKIQKTDVQIQMGSGTWRLVGNVPSTPRIDDTIFPPAL